MAKYINIGNTDFASVRKDEYVDKSQLIAYVNHVLGTQRNDHSAEGAIRQIKEKQYVDTLHGYIGDIVLVGINYDKRTKKHTCVIEKASDGVAINVAINSKCGDNSVLSSDQVSDQVVTKYSLSCDQVVALLNALCEAIPAALMRQLCGRANATYFRRTTIQPMLDDGIIVPTDLESINSPKQRYYLTPKGIELLKQLTK